MENIERLVWVVTGSTAMEPNSIRISRVLDCISIKQSKGIVRLNKQEIPDLIDALRRMLAEKSL